MKRTCLRREETEKQRIDDKRTVSVTLKYDIAYTFIMQTLWFNFIVMMMIEDAGRIATKVAATRENGSCVKIIKECYSL